MKNKSFFPLSPITTTILLLAILILGFVLRIIHLSSQSLWLDELQTAASCLPSVTMERFWVIYTHDPHPPLYYLIQKIWLYFAGIDDKIIRAPSVVFGVWGIYAIYIFGKRLFNPTFGLMTALLLAVNSFHIEYSQEARPYTLLFALSTFSFRYLYEILVRSEKKYLSLILYVLVSTAMLYTHYFGVLLLIVQALIVIIVLLLNPVFEDVKAVCGRFAVSILIIGICFLPQIPVLLRLMQIAKNEVLWANMKEFLGDNIFIIYFFLFALGVALLIISKKKRVLSTGTLPIFYVLLWFLLGHLVPFAKSLLSSPVMLPRYYSGVFPSIIIILVLGIFYFRNTTIQVLITICLTSISILHTFHDRRVYFKQTKSDWRAIGKFLAENNQKNYPLRDITPENNIVEMQYGGIYSYYPNYYGNNNTQMIKDEAFLNSSFKGIWLFDSWWMPGNEEFIKKLEAKGFSKTKEFWAFGASAKLYEKE
jgi:mannosyltransferase